MKQIQIAEFGSPEVLTLEETAAPEPNANQLLVDVHYAAINPIDYKTRKGLGFLAEKVKKRLPWSPGYDFAGTVVQVGDQVQEWEPGHRICGMANFPLPAGAYAEQLVVNSDSLVRIPDSIDDKTAAALPLAGLTAWQGLFEVGNLCSGQNILVLAAAGGVGHFAAQLAKGCGAHVWGTASEKHHLFLRKLNIEPVDYHQPEAFQSLPAMDFVFDGVGGDTGTAALNYLKDNGMLVTVPTISAETIIRTAKQQHKNAKGFTVHPESNQLQMLLQKVEDKVLKVMVSAIYPLEAATEAHRQIEAGHTQGKILLAMKDR